jgi:IPT/TIG domain
MGSEDPQEKLFVAAAKRARRTAGLARARARRPRGVVVRATLVLVTALLVSGLGSMPAHGLAIPSVTAVEPNKGPASGGIEVTIKGTNLSEATAVKFGAVAATEIKPETAESLTAVAPAQGAGTVHVKVTTEGGTSEPTAADQFTYVAAPAVTSVEPSSGPETGGTEVTIKGTNLAEASSVHFGATAGEIKTDTTESMTVVAPVHPAGAVDVTVTTVGGTSAASEADQFTYLVAPTVTAVEPNRGPEAGETSVTIRGTGFSSVEEVDFGATAAATFVIESETTITVLSPAGTGTVDVTVIAEGVTSATSEADQFTYAAPPTVTAVEPRTGPAAGGASVTVTGTNLTAATSVRFGANAATSFKVASPTSIVATAPAGSGMVDVVVTTPGGTSGTGAADVYTYVQPAVEEPPKPPAPVPAANCTLKPIFLTIERKRKGKAKPKITGGALRVTVTCDQNANVTLAGRLGVVGKKPKRGKARTKVYVLGPSTTAVVKGAPAPVVLRLPLAALHALAKKARESVRITLSATDTGGTSHNAVRIKQLRL